MLLEADAKPANNMIMFFLQLISFTDYKFVCLRNFATESACAPSTNTGFLV